MINKIKSTDTTNFGNHVICTDIGASKYLLATMKNRLLLTDSADIFYKTTVFKRSNQKRNAETFVRSIANNILQIEKKYAKEIQEHDPDRILDIILDVPGPYINDQVYIPNILDNKNNPIGFIDIKTIPAMLAEKGVNVGSFVPVNAAAGGCVYRKLENKYPELLQEGNEIFYIYPGGGLGSGSIIIDKTEVKIVPRERQHVKAAFSNKSIEAEGGCATSFVNNYISALEHLIPLNVLNALRSSKYLGADTVTKLVPPKFMKEYTGSHQLAAKYAMDKFIDSIAQLISIEITGGKTKSAVLTGKTAGGIIDGIKNNPLYKDNNDALALVNESLKKHLTPVGAQLMGDDFRVVFVPLSDSTEGSDILVNSYNVGKQAWINIPRDNLAIKY